MLTTHPDAVEVTYDGKAHELYISAENLDKFVAFLGGDAPLVQGDGTVTASASPSPAASTVPKGAKSAFATAKTDQMRVLRAWAKDNGHDVPDVGAAKQAAYTAFFADHPDLPVLVGRNAMSIKDWHAAEQEVQATA